MTVEEVLVELNKLANPDVVAFKKKKYGIEAHQSLGVMQKDINTVVKRIKKDEVLARELYSTGIYEARILCAKIFPPKKLTLEDVEQWSADFENWESCDVFCMAVFAKSDLALHVINNWYKKEGEFLRRTSYATLASYTMAHKNGSNKEFELFYPMILEHANDNRVYVKKAISWALRSIGKRNIDLNLSALDCAEQILKQDTRAARWIAKDVIRELSKKDLRYRNYPRAIYG